MVLILSLSVTLMLADLFWSPMAYYRGYMSLTVTPLRWMMDLPPRLMTRIDNSLSDRDELLQENDKLRADLLLMARKLQRFDAMDNDNARLRNLLGVRKQLDLRVLLAELIGVSADPFSHQITINKGLQDQVYLGQPVLDEGGVMGQVVEVGPYTSRALLITDAQHAIPVQVSRSGFRALLLGRGNDQGLLLDHVPNTADIQVGDLLLSSGLGARFPKGYPVATVVEVIHDPGQPFAIVRCLPSAQLDTSRHLLLVFSQTRTPLLSPKGSNASGSVRSEEEL
ncbi:MAG: rod shape-determining protein MreC [Motiliproteus sp.]|jgi:rod shape-determining protein MreC